MKQILCILVLSSCLSSVPKTEAQSGLGISTSTGLKVLVVQKDFPLLKLLLPNQSITERGIEIEFPEHVTGFNQKIIALNTFILYLMEIPTKEHCLSGALKAIHSFMNRNWIVR